MKNKHIMGLVAMLLCFPFWLIAQKSVLLSLGTDTCGSFFQPRFFSLKDPLTNSPQLQSNCGLSSISPDPFNMFVAYNPANNKAYVTDVRIEAETKIWVVDLGLPNNINCTGSLPVLPTYTYSFSSNNFEFDNDGRLWSLSDYNFVNGQARLDKIDVTTGATISTRALQFPLSNLPLLIGSGDICILPNGRFFAVLGVFPAKLYEITNYTGSATATATYLTIMPKDCYGIAFINGKLQITGYEVAPTPNCFYFEYNIGTGTLGPQQLFPLGKSPTDNSSFSPAIGCSKRLVSAAMVNSNTYDLQYELFIENMGNVRLNNANVNDDLQTAFGAGNVSNVQASFVAGSNVAVLVLNPSYNGTNNTQLLLPAQILPNRTQASQNYFVRINIACRVTNIQSGTTYLNSAISTAEIGSAASGTLTLLADSSNNGGSTAVDVNADGNANEPGENIPTPFSLTVLPVKFLDIQGYLTNETTAAIKWQIDIPVSNARNFEVEFSTDGRRFVSIGSIAITNNRQAGYQFEHFSVPAGILFYRIRQTDADGSYIYSSVVTLRRNNRQAHIAVYPNPASEILQVTLDNLQRGKTTLMLFDEAGRLCLHQELIYTSSSIPVKYLANGWYLLKVVNRNNISMQKVLIQHK